MNKPTIYCVEDDDSIRELISYVLSGQRFPVKTFPSAEEFWEEMKKVVPDLVLLDIMLPGENGLTILKKLKEQAAYRRIPVILLTAKTGEIDIISGLDQGADDYMTKPFRVMELLSRINALWRRTKPAPSNTILRGAHIYVDKATRSVVVDEQEISVTHKEYELLVYLMENKDLVLSREQLMNHVWGFSYEGESRTVDMHIMTLRQKLHTAGRAIKTVRSVGYRWKGEDS